MLVMVVRGDVEEVPTLHALWHGFPLCRFSLVPPGLWPKGHWWVRAADADAPMIINCEGCREELKTWKTTNQTAK
jgi:hypothetical protein